MRLALLFVLAGSVPLCAQSWTLRHLPASASYELSATDTVRVEASGRDTERSTPVRRIVTRRIALARGGLLAVEQVEGSTSLGLGAGTMRVGPLQPPARFTVKPTGEGAGGPGLELLLPTGAVTSGARWETRAPPSERAPIELVTRWHLERVETVAGRSCLIIAGAVAGAATVPPRGARVTHSGKVRLAFDPRAGLIVRAVSEATTVVEEPPDARGRPRRKTTRIASHLTLLET